jgi:thiamine-monophosphate kinase
MTARSGEFERIAALARTFGAQPAPGVSRGIGDDAAILDPASRGEAGRALVWTVDAQVDGVHFRSDLVGLHDVGFRSFMAAASDLAAMGASPWCALSSLVVPAILDDAALSALTGGQAEAATAMGAPVVGGNLSRGEALSITTSLLGTCARAVPRFARAGDGLWIAGAVGLAAAGLLGLERRQDDPRLVPAVAAWRRPRARVSDGLAMAAVATGAIDVSDGLAQDAGHLARAASLRAVIDEARLLAHGGPTLAAAAACLGVDALDLALHGGEDYALLVASAEPVAGFTAIGSFEEGEGVALASGGSTRAIAPRGWDHFEPRRERL